MIDEGIELITLSFHGVSVKYVTVPELSSIDDVDGDMASLRSELILSSPEAPMTCDAMVVFPHTEMMSVWTNHITKPLLVTAMIHVSHEVAHYIMLLRQIGDLPDTEI